MCRALLSGGGGVNMGGGEAVVDVVGLWVKMERVVLGGGIGGWAS